MLAITAASHGMQGLTIQCAVEAIHCSCGGCYSVLQYVMHDEMHPMRNFVSITSVTSTTDRTEQQTAEVMSLTRASAANSSSVSLEQFLNISRSILPCSYASCSQILPVLQ